MPFTGKYGYIDETGKEVIVCKYNAAYEFRDNGLAEVGIITGRDEEGEAIWKYGFINKEGKEVVPITYESVAEGFGKDDLVAIAKKYGTRPYEWGFADETGEEVIPCQFLDSMGYQNFIWSEDHLLSIPFWKFGPEEAEIYGVINEDGEEIIPFDYVEINLSRSGKDLISASKYMESEDGEPFVKAGFINKNNVEVIPFAYDATKSFEEEGLAPVARIIDYNGDEEIYQWGYVNEEGTMVIPYQFSDAEPFYACGLAAVQNEDDKWGYINNTGNLVIPYEYDSAESFDEDGIAVVSKYVDENYLDGLINTEGTEILPCEYNSIVTYTHLDEKNETISIAKKNGQDDYIYGFANKKGEIIVDIQFDMIQSGYGENQWAVVGTTTGQLDKYDKTYKCKYINLNGDEMLELPDKYIFAGNFS
ncbi:MAG: WG repeat-containing protein [Lachnospiraceae bacterium]|nr:WG repeat-containing protein [Lachnospiraceae bacterium]